MNMQKSFKLAVQYMTDDSELPARSQFRRWVKSALEQNAEIVVRIVGAPEGRTLNHQYLSLIHI